MTCASGLPAVLKVALPVARSAFAASLAVAISEPTFTLEPVPNTMPLALISTTLPLASRLPRICDGLLPPMRFTATELVAGCTNFVVWPAAILKAFQLMMTMSEV